MFDDAVADLDVAVDDASAISARALVYLADHPSDTFISSVLLSISADLSDASDCLDSAWTKYINGNTSYNAGINDYANHDYYACMSDCNSALVSYYQSGLDVASANTYISMANSDLSMLDSYLSIMGY